MPSGEEPGQLKMAAWILDISYFLQQKRGEYPAIYLDRARSSKDLLYGKKYFFFCATKWVILTEQKRLTLPTREAANQSREFASSCLKPPGDPPGNSWWGCAARFSKS